MKHAATSRTVVRFLLGALALVGLQVAQATTISPTGAVGVTYGSGYAQITDGASDFARLLSRNVSSSGIGATVTDSMSLRVGGSDIGVGLVRAVSGAELAAATVAVGAAAWGGWQVGTALANYMGLGTASEGARVAPTAGGWMYDPGVAPTPGTTTQCQKFRSGNNTVLPGCFGGATVTAQAALDAANWVIAQPGSRLTYPGPVTTYDCGGFTVGSYWAGGFNISGGTPADANHTACVPWGGGGSYSDYMTATVTTSASCPPYVDALNPAYSNSSPTPGADGMCPTGRYSQALDAATAAARIAGGAVSGYGAGLLNDVLSKGQPVTVAAPYAPTNPNPTSVTGQPTTTTTTNPDGSTVTTTTTPKTNFGVSGDKVTYNTQNTTVTNTCTAASSCSSTTTVTNSTPTPDPTDPCTENPDSAGCVKLGGPTTETVPKTSSPVTITPVAFASGSCPPPITFTAMGHAYSFDYASMCDTATNSVRPVVLLIGVALGAWVFIGGLKS